VLLASRLLPAAHAANIEKLIMPGPVSKAHAKFEGDCSSCHDRANRERQTALCLDCHKDTAADISTKTRYHGRMQAGCGGSMPGLPHGAPGPRCRYQQAEPGWFHARSDDFPLKDAHVALACGACHWSRRSLPQDPFDLHRVPSQG